MAIEEAINERLEATSALTDLIGGTASRIYPVKVSNATFPYITWERLGSDRHAQQVMGLGSVDVDADLRFHVWSQDTATTAGFDEGKSVAVQLRKALHNYAATAQSTTIDYFEALEEFDIPDPTPDVFHRVVEFRCVFTDV